MNKLLIWDIDGTMLDCKGSGRNALNIAFESIYGFKDAFKNVDLAGKIDSEIISEIVEKHEIKEFNHKRFAIEYGYVLEEVMKKTDGIKVFDGVEMLLKEFYMKKNYYLSLATGNCKTGAYGKLKYCKINQYFDTGAFGDEAYNRNELLNLAIDNAKMLYGIDFAKENIFYFGDTPNDIEAARTNGIKSIAISTGMFAYDVLKKHKPDFLLNGLKDINHNDKIFEY